MAFHEIRFPDNISRGARGGPERRTQIVELASGDEERNASWANSRRRYDVAYGIRRADDLAAVVAFFEARNGRLFGFRYKDWADYKSSLPSQAITPTDQQIGTGTGSHCVPADQTLHLGRADVDPDMTTSSPPAVKLGTSSQPTPKPSPPSPPELGQRSNERAVGIKGGGAAGIATVGAAGVEVAQDVLAETQSAILPLVPYLDTLRWVFIAVALIGIAAAIHARIDDWKRGQR